MTRQQLLDLVPGKTWLNIIGPDVHGVMTGIHSGLVQEVLINTARVRISKYWFFPSSLELTPDPLVKEAREFAFWHHAGQMYGDKLYTYHLEEVVSLLSSYDSRVQAVGYLHDILEETDVHYSTLRNRFGNEIANLVLLLTDSRGEARRARKAATNKKLAAIDDEYKEALIVKAADRLANIKAGGKIEMYRREHAEFKKAVHRPGLTDWFFAEMDDLLAVKPFAPGTQVWVRAKINAIEGDSAKLDMHSLSNNSLGIQVVVNVPLHDIRSVKGK